MHKCGRRAEPCQALRRPPPPSACSAATPGTSCGPAPPGKFTDDINVTTVTKSHPEISLTLKCVSFPNLPKKSYLI